LTLEDRTQHGRIAKGIKANNRSLDAAKPVQDRISEAYHSLYLLDFEMHARMRTVTDAVNQLDSADGQQVLAMLTGEYQWMKKVEGEVRVMQVDGDACNEEYRDAFLISLQENTEAVKTIMDVVARRTQEGQNSTSAIVDTGEPYYNNQE
jgi:hypothetical protein